MVSRTGTLVGKRSTAVNDAAAGCHDSNSECISHPALVASINSTSTESARIIYNDRP
ncbi:MAG: hypothetical protein NTY15_21610 [Planctomycetota bacterium]|nr:hypothetical protein [Planctomycetota bacterium]